METSPGGSHAIISATPRWPVTPFKTLPQYCDIADIAQMYEAGDTAAQIASRYGISKARVATVLRERGVTLRHQGLTDEQVSEAAGLYAAGRSLAWIGSRYDVSPPQPSPLRFGGKGFYCGRGQAGSNPRRSRAKFGCGYSRIPYPS